MPLILLLLVACTTTDPGVGAVGGDDSGGAAGTAAITDLTVTADDDVVTVLTATWTTDRPGTSWVSWGNGRQSPEGSETGTSHSALVLGVAEGSTVRLTAHTRLDDGTELQSEPLEVAVASAPSGLPRVSITSVDEAAWAGDGYLLTSYIQPNDSYVVILDRLGRVVWYKAAEAHHTITTSKPGLDGQSLLYAEYDADQVEDLGVVRRVDLATGDVLTTTRTLTGHHDFAELPGGGLAWLGLDTVEWGDGLVTQDVVYVGEEGVETEGHERALFRYTDDVEISPPCDHFWTEAYGTGGRDWTHGNSLMYDADQDAFFVMAKNLDSLHKLDASTGEVLWQMGGVGSDFLMTGGFDGWWSHGHMSWIQGDVALIFDNGYHHDPMVSGVRGYRFDEAARTVSLEFSWVDPDDRFIPLLGDIRLLDNGNYLTVWTSAGLARELTPDGDVVWQAELGVGSAMGRVHYLADLYAF